MKRTVRAWVMLSLAAAALATPGVRAGAEGFFGLGDLSGGSSSSRAWGISADGSTIVGESSSASGTQAFRWTEAGGMVGLGDLAGGEFESVAHGVSADGSVVVGSGRSAASGAGREAFRWTSSGGMAGLGDLDGGRFDSVAFGVSADGSVVVGSGQVSFAGSVSASSAFRWSSADGLVGIGPDSPFGPALPNLSVAYGVSADGLTIAGRFSAPDPFQDAKAGRWTEAGGWSSYPGPSGSDAGGQAMAVSADGSVLVGSVNAPSPAVSNNAFRWEQGGGAAFLHEVPDDGTSPFGNTIASAVSADGSIVVGTAFAWGLPSDLGQRPGLSPFTRPFVWDEVNGFRLLQDELVAMGVDLGGWTLLEAQGISADGSVLTGTGINPLGHFEGWVVILGGSIGGASPPSVVPEPSTLAMVAVGPGLIALARSRRRRSAGSR
jgi:probable HAF family extracellular repeat protein